MVVRKSLEKEPSNRYENVTAMVGDLLVLHAKVRRGHELSRT